MTAARCPLGVSIATKATLPTRTPSTAASKHERHARAHVHACTHTHARVYAPTRTSARRVQRRRRCPPPTHTHARTLARARSHTHTLNKACDERRKGARAVASPCARKCVPLVFAHARSSRSSLEASRLAQSLRGGLCRDAHKPAAVAPLDRPSLLVRVVLIRPR